VGREGFGDHHRFTPAELAELWRKAERLGSAALVTSEKDAVRLPAVPSEGPPLWVTRLELEFQGGSEVLERLLLWGLRAWRWRP
jgi:tetraacyldisaccharide-1-P 4'-kinase